jgi:hypothetical protein
MNTILITEMRPHQIEIDNCFACKYARGGYQTTRNGVEEGSTTCVLLQEDRHYPFPIPDNCPILTGRFPE